MALIPRTVGELKRYLDTFPDDLLIFVQGNTERDRNAVPERFVVEYWGPNEGVSKDYFLLFAVINRKAPGEIYRSEKNRK